MTNIILRRLLLAACLLPLPGCRLDFTRTQRGQPLRFDDFHELQPRETRREDAVERLGAPDRVRWESGKSRLTWEHEDSTFIQLRLQVPFSIFGYRHNLFQYFEDQRNVNAMDLLFDESGLLEQKTLRLHDAYKTPHEPGSWRLVLTPRFEHSFLLLGDADFQDYDEIFDDGFVAGFDLGIQPVPPAVVKLGGRYQIHDGRTISAGTTRVSFDDLELFTAEASVRLQLPLRILFDTEQLQNVWTLLLEDDPAVFEGWLVFLEAGLGVTFNGNVPVALDGMPGGNFFDAGPGLSSSIGVGIEYSWEGISVQAAFVYRTSDGFDEGNSPLPADADRFQSFLGMASVSLKF